MRLRSIAPFVVAFSGPALAQAQVNVEQLRGDYREGPARAQLEASFTGRTGNVQSFEAGGGAIGAARLGRHGFFGSSRADYARFNHTTTVSKSFIHLRYELHLLSWLSAEVYVQQQQDKFQRLLLRELVGTGPRFVFVDEEDLKIAYGASYMFEYERIAVAEGAADAPMTFSHRFSNYLTSTWKPDSRVTATSTVYVQPRWDAFDDTRVLFETAISTAIAKRLALKFLATVRYDSAPPTTVKTTDAEVRNAIVLKF